MNMETGITESIFALEELIYKLSEGECVQFELTKALSSILTSKLHSVSEVTKSLLHVVWYSKKYVSDGTSYQFLNALISLSSLSFQTTQVTISILLQAICFSLQVNDHFAKCLLNSFIKGFLDLKCVVTSLNG